VAGLAGATHDGVRRHNLASVLRRLHLYGAVSRTELTAHTGLNRSTVGDLAAELVAAGLAREAGAEPRSTAGRPSLLLAPNSDGVYVLALDVAVDGLVAARVGLGGQVLSRRHLVQPRAEHDVDWVGIRLARLARQVVASAPDGARCVGVGVAVCGSVSHPDGFVRFAPNLGWVDVPLGKLLLERLGTDVDVHIGNDATLGALAEHMRGAAAGANSAVYLSGEVGVGAGVISDGRLLLGAGGYLGEVGHMMVNPRGRRCRCGARGCWETEVGEEALLAAAGLPSTAQVGEVLAAAAGGDRTAVAALRRTGTWLGLGIANLVNLFNPQVVICGGLLREVFPAVEPATTDAMRRALIAPGEMVQVCLPGLGAYSTVLGAAEAAFESLLVDPLGTLSRSSGQLFT